MLHKGWLQRRSILIQVLLHILVEILEDQVQLVLPVGDVLQLDDVGVA